MRKSNVIVLGIGLLVSMVIGCTDQNPRDEKAQQKPVFLYSLYFHAKGDNRYLDTTDFADMLSRLKKNFDVRVSWEPPTEELLADIDVLLVASPNDSAVGDNPPPPHMSDKDISVLTKFVADGGGFMMLSNQDPKHNIEKKESNMLLANFGLQINHLCLGAKKLQISDDVPLLGGLSWAVYWMPTIDIIDGTRLQSIVIVENDISQKPMRPEDDDHSGALMVWGKFKKGRVVVVSDTGWISEWALSETGASDTVIRGANNWEIMRRLSLWAAGLDEAILLNVPPKNIEAMSEGELE